MVLRGAGTHDDIGHMGFILALQEGISIDITGGTSVGSLTRGYYTKNIDLSETIAKAKAYKNVLVDGGDGCLISNIRSLQGIRVCDSFAYINKV